MASEPSSPRPRRRRRGKIAVGAVLVALALGWANFRLLSAAGMPARAARPIAFLFALLTPVCLLALAAATWGLAALTPH